MNRKFVSILLVFLFMSSVAIPPAAAEPIFAAPAIAPAAAELFLDGVTIMVSSAVVMEIGQNLGKAWDGASDSWEDFVESVSAGLDDLIHAKEWIKIHSGEGKALMTAVYECFNTGGSSGGKKNDKWYFEARLNRGEIEINPEAMTEEQAVKEMGRGKHLMTIDRDIAEAIVNKYNRAPKGTTVDIEMHSGGKEKFFDHANYNAKGMRLHCWIWRP